MKYLNIILGTVIFLSFVGCAQKQPVITKIVYRDKQCPTPKIKPVFKEYKMVILKINGTEYYALQKSEAVKMATNWISYREWAEANYLLIKIKKKEK